MARSGYDDTVLWTHNDSGDMARIFAVNKYGATKATLSLSGVRALDWEAMTRLRRPDGSSWLYIGDIGDNAHARSEIAVHRVAEPRTLVSGSLTPTTYRLRYADGPHDAEALLVHPSTGRLYIVTKDSNGGGVYVAPSTLSTSSVNTMTRIASAPKTVTDGTFLYDGRMVVRNYTTGYVSKGPGQPNTAFTLPSCAQGESLTSAAGNTSVHVGTEGLASPVWKVSVPAS